MRTPIVTSEYNQIDSSVPVANAHSLLSETNKTLLNQIPNFAFILHSNSVYINKDFQQYLNLETQHIELQNILDTIHPNDVAKFKKLLTNQTDHSHNIEHQFRIINKVGEYHWFLVLAKPNLTSAKTIEWFISLIDVEQQYQSHQNVLTEKKKKKEMS